MQKIALNDELSLSRIVYGMWRLGDVEDTSPFHVQEKVEACLKQGITTMDQADIYGAYIAEGLLGACLRQAPHLREKLEIVTKCDIVAPIGMHSDKPVKYYDTSAAYITTAVERSLSEMATDYIDVLLIHRPDPLMNAAETGATLDGLIKNGKIRSAGVSNFGPRDFDLLQANMKNKLVINQIEISPLCTQSFTNGDLAYCQQHKISPMAWSPLGGGNLFGSDCPEALASILDEIAENHGVDRTAVTLAWLLHHPANILPVMGTNNLDRIKKFSDAFKVSMDRVSWFQIYEAAIGHEVP